jgi:hypothetical protein
MLLKRHIEDFKKDQDEPYRVMHLPMIFRQRELKRSIEKWKDPDLEGQAYWANEMAEGRT